MQWRTQDFILGRSELEKNVNCKTDAGGVRGLGRSPSRGPGDGVLGGGEGGGAPAKKISVNKHL